jgi:hypothetical protein
MPLLCDILPLRAPSDSFIYAGAPSPAARSWLVRFDFGCLAWGRDAISIGAGMASCEETDCGLSQELDGLKDGVLAKKSKLAVFSGK